MIHFKCLIMIFRQILLACSTRVEAGVIINSVLKRSQFPVDFVLKDPREKEDDKKEEVLEHRKE